MSTEVEVNYTKEEQAGISSLRERGFAVIIWTPEEIGTNNIEELEEHSIRAGGEFLGLDPYGDDDTEEAEPDLEPAAQTAVVNPYGDEDLPEGWGRNKDSRG